MICVFFADPSIFVDGDLIESEEIEESNEDSTVVESANSEETTQPNANEDLSKDQAPWYKFCVENLKHYNLGDSLKTSEQESWVFSVNTDV